MSQAWNDWLSKTNNRWKIIAGCIVPIFVGCIGAVALLIVPILGPLSENSPSDYQLAVLVTDPTNGTLSNARIILFTENGSQEKFTDSQGTAVLSVQSVKDPSARLIIQASGYEVHQDEISLSRQNRMEISLLEKEELLGTVIVRTVNGSTHEPVVNARITVITGDLILDEVSDSRGLVTFEIEFPIQVIEVELTADSKEYGRVSLNTVFQRDSLYDVVLHPSVEEDSAVGEIEELVIDVEDPSLNSDGGYLPSGDWSVRAYNTDDANIIVVNGHIVGASYYGANVDWVSINSWLNESSPNIINFINLNGGAKATWGFSLERDDTIVWGNESGNDVGGIAFLKTVQINGDGTVKEVNLQDFDKEFLQGDWSARAIANDFGVILVNGVPVSGSYGNNSPGGWVDIGSLLYADQNNVISVAVWNLEGDYSWDFGIRNGETIIWGNNNKGNGQTGDVFYKSVVLDKFGNVQE